MKVVRLYMNNRLRNFNYIIGCEKTGQAIALDPLDGDAVLAAAEAEGWQIKLIINTHEHHDHIEGNPVVQAVTGAPIWASEYAVGKIPNVAKGLVANEVIELGSMVFKVLPTPGHTPVHVCLLTLSEEIPVLFSGDTLFNACAGNCFNGGNVDEMYETFQQVLAPLPDNAILYPGHDYMKTNLEFSLVCEPGNQDAQLWQGHVKNLSPEDMPFMTLGQERLYNPFLRLESPQLLAKLEASGDMSTSSRAVFKALRLRRDHW
ncbi:Hydroxyacylglutathione hydrolase [Oleispira antarctica RB-8]|uniref:hydroxyacylglutathione hydrolase n=1 Tax=Oleispira antarctica RB-8 TaxID=698738 RepID=R4YTD3_OLEAN|nr:Hydroxyacylglutathione hydrolase [Oleispira antarctica RB-8]